MTNFDLTVAERKNIIEYVHAALDEYYADTKQLNIAPALDEGKIKKYARQLSFDQQNDIHEVLTSVINGLREFAVHTPHPGYFGLFNPRPIYLSGLADYITALFNPQLAAWSHAPYANEIERYIVEEFTKKLGYATSSSDGTFCTAGAESNLTAVQCAITHHFPKVIEEGLMALTKRPMIYCSSESHHSIVKAARTTGLGSDSVQSLPVYTDLTMNIEILENQIEKDISEGNQPFMIVATAGTTGSGAIDNLESIAEICKNHNLWFHVDAAFGGGAIASENYSDILSGIEKSDSVMLDLHKWFSVPMATSLFLTSHRSILYNSFNIKTKYMPEDGDQVTRIDPYIHSIQWSRRFNGLRIFLPMAVYGWEGYDQVISKQLELGDLLRKRLLENGWIIKNATKLPVVCFTHLKLEDHDEKVTSFVEGIIATGKAWVSSYPVHGKLTIRACISNYITSENDLTEFTELLDHLIAQY